MSLPLTVESVSAALRGVIDPELGDNIVDLGMLRDVSVGDDGLVAVTVALTIAGCPLRTQLRRDVEARVSSLSGVSSVEVRMGEMTASERSAVMARARWKARQDVSKIPASTRVVAVASGKGGVGKSSVSVNLAVALALRGYAVGLLDADIWGFSIPRMLGATGRLQAEGDAQAWTIVPQSLAFGSGRVEVVSMGLLAASEDEAIMWRGLLLNRALQHFVENVQWGGGRGPGGSSADGSGAGSTLDYLLIDMPPGTGDVQMGLARMLPRTEVLIVTTPPAAAAKVAARVADMARKGWLRVAGVIENMSSFTCEHGSTYELFGSGGGQRLADEVGVPLIGSVPFDPSVATGSDAGRPAVLDDGPVAAAFGLIVERIVSEVIPPVEMSGCTARMLDAMEAAAGPGNLPS